MTTVKNCLEIENKVTAVVGRLYTVNGEIRLLMENVKKENLLKVKNGKDFKISIARLIDDKKGYNQIQVVLATVNYFRICSLD